MTSTNNIFIAELKNLYALEKQSIDILDSIQDQIEHRKLKKRINKIRKRSSKNLNFVHNYLKSQGINPGNVTDSIAVEIQKNFEDITNAELPQPIKDLSLWMSLNRLISYTIACYQNTFVITDKRKEKNFRKNLSKAIKKYMKELDKLHGKTHKNLIETVNNSEK